MGILGSICFIVATLITSVQLVVGSGSDYFLKEYNKYQISEVVSISLEDLETVTVTMMDYLLGDREDLIVTVNRNNQEREFFNETEKLHMKDVKGIFYRGIIARRVSVVFILCALMFCLKKEKNGLKLILKAYQVVFVFFASVFSLTALIISTNFTKYFIIFHEIVFTNKLWLLDPDTDLLINILPEAFFVDTAINILFKFAMITTLLFLLSFGITKKKNKLSVFTEPTINREQL